MTDVDSASYYRVFLLTVWQEPTQGPDAPAVFRFRLEDPRTGERRGFVSAEDLVAALDKDVLVGNE